uniref:AP2/ERF domain-containing protein n=1 Tax=Lotharella globosa TaxID=91324 RepID=A0A7S3YSZ1_9EUKA
MSATTGCSPVFLKLSLAGNASGGLLDAPIPEHEEVEVDLSPHVVKSGGLRASQEHVERKNTQEREFIEWRSHIIQEASLKQQRKRKTSTPVHRADLEALSIIPPSKKTNATEVPKSANGHLEIHEHKQMTNLLNPTRTRVSRINAHLDMGMRKGRASPSPLGKKGPYQDASSRGVTKSRSRSRKGSKTRISGAKKGGAFVSPARKVTSKYIGVSYHSNRGKWQVKIRSNGKQKHLGYFDDEIEAARAYNCAAIAVHANPKLNKVSDVDLKEGSHALKARIMDITQPKAEPQVCKHYVGVLYEYLRMEASKREGTGFLFGCLPEEHHRHISFLFSHHVEDVPRTPSM